MADSQAEGLRKAYAEIMLNMAKESAARVLAAERRAAVLAGGVATAKEDGIAALVRLKAIMEARIKEVESQSSAHDKKINELQEQLHGAQNTVAFLQVELQRANTELEQTRKTLAEERIKILPTCDRIDSNKNRSSRSKIHLRDRSVPLRNRMTVDGNRHVPTNAKDGVVESLENLYHCSSDLASLMARNKKPELYRNGCTQRIRALNHRNSSADSSDKNRKHASVLNSRPNTGKVTTAKNLPDTRSIMEQILQTKFLANYKRKRGIRRRPSSKHESSGEPEKAEDISFDRSDGNGCLLLLQALEQDLSQPNVSAGHSVEGLAGLKDASLIGGSDADLNLCTVSPGLKDAHSVDSMQMRRKRSKTVRVFEAGHSEFKGLPVSTNENNMVSSEQSSGVIDNCFDTPLRNNTPVLLCTTENLMHLADPNTGQLESGSSSPIVRLTKSQIGDEGDLQVDRAELRTPEDNSAVWKEVKVEEGCILASDVSGALVISSLDNEQDAKSSSTASVQAEGARCIKYTFNRRKRKGASLDCTLEGAVPEKSSSLVSLADTQEPQAKPETQDLLIESPRGDNQLAHVAEQLILLSERKW